MTSIHKILFIVAAVQWFLVDGNPFFQGISFQRGFEINFKPFPRKPIAFISEKWSPFGVFGKKFAISKRSLDDIVPPPPSRVPRPAAPVFEQVDDIEEISTGPLLILPRPVAKPPPLLVPPKPPVPVPIVAPKPPPPPPPPVEIVPPKPPAPLPVPLPIIVTELPLLPGNTPIVPPISTNMVIIHPKVVNSHITTKKLYTDISKVDAVKEHIKGIKPVPPPPVEKTPPVAAVPTAVIDPKVPPPVEHIAPAQPIKLIVTPPPPVNIKDSSSPPPVEHKVPPPPPPAPIVPPPPPVTLVSPPPLPPKPPVPPHPVPIKEEKVVVPLEKTEIFLKDSSIVRGSKMALQFGTVFLTLMAQFLDSARASIDQMTNPPPIFNN